MTTINKKSLLKFGELFLFEIQLVLNTSIRIVIFFTFIRQSICKPKPDILLLLHFVLGINPSSYLLKLM